MAKADACDKCGSTSFIPGYEVRKVTEESHTFRPYLKCLKCGLPLGKKYVLRDHDHQRIAKKIITNKITQEEHYDYFGR